MPVGRTLLALFLFAAVSIGADLRTLDGKTVSGEVAQLTDKEIVLRSGGKDIATPIDQVLVLELGATAPAKLTGVKYIDVELTDGSLLHCAQVSFKGKEATLTLVSGQVVKTPLEAISYVVNDAQEDKTQQEWKEQISKKRSSDILAVRREGELQTLKGTFGDASDDGKKIQFDLNSKGEMRGVPLEPIHGMLFLRQPDPKAPPTLCKVYDTQANVVMMAAADVTAAGFTVTTPSGVKIEYTRALVARFDYSRDKVRYLSDMEPVKVIQTSTQGDPEPYRRDKNLDGIAGLRLGGKIYNKGLAVHAYTSLEYQLDGEYREFTALLGIDENVGGSDGQTVVKIEGDGKELASETISRKDKDLPRKIQRSVSGVQRLRIVVQSPDILDLGKHVDLADAKVSK
jgi:hypothetical protein